MVGHPSLSKFENRTDKKDFSWNIVHNSSDIHEDFIRLLQYQNLSIEEFSLAEKFINGTQTKFVCVSINSEPALLFPIQEVWLSRANFPSLKRTFWQRLTSMIIDISCINLVFPGNLLQIDKSYLAFNNSAIEEEDAYHIQLEVIQQISQNQSYTVQLIHVPNHIGMLVEDKLQKLGFEQPLPDFEMNLAIRPHWTNWESYLTDVTKKYAARAKKIRESASTLNLKFLSETEIVALETEIQLLYLQTIQKQDVALAKATKGYFSSLKKTYGNAFQIKGIFKGDKLIGFYTWFDKDDSIEMHFIGLEYQLNHTHNLYFNILFEGMLDAIHLGKKTVAYGRTCLDAKASVGAKATVSASYLKLGKIHSCVSDTIQNYISKIENESWKERNPLK